MTPCLLRQGTTLSIDRTGAVFVICAAAALALRLWAGAASPLDLQYDEAQYWFWSRSFDWGYFSKPPLIAWAIAATTGLFGNAEWAVRMAAPIAQTVAAAVLFALGRGMYGPAAGLWAGLTWLALPAVWVSSAVISTDALLMPLWAAALFALWRLQESRRWAWALALGAAIGFGLLAKYAMLYFLLCAALAALWAPPIRRALLSAQGLAAGALALAILAPNLIWNAANSFATISHTAENAGGGDIGLHPDEVLEFVLGQALVAGPVLLAALVALGLRCIARPGDLDLRDRFLIPFVAPPLLIIVAQALLSHAHANWAAAAYPAAVVWAVGRLVRERTGQAVLAASLAVNLGLGAVAAGAALNPLFAERAGLSGALEDSRGWRQTARLTAQMLSAHGPVSAIMTDHRALFFELSYYWPADERPPLRMWVLRGAARNHAEAVAPMTADLGARTLVVHMQPRYRDVVAGDFARFREVGRYEIDLGGGERRVLIFSIGEGFAPLPRDAAFLARIGE